MIRVATAVWEINDHKSCPYKKGPRPANKTGHIVRACKSKKRKTQATRPPVNYVDSDDYLGSLEVNNVSHKDYVIWVSLKYRKGGQDGTTVDTGSAVSVLPYKWT